MFGTAQQPLGGEVDERINTDGHGTPKTKQERGSVNIRLTWLFGWCSRNFEYLSPFRKDTIFRWLFPSCLFTVSGIGELCWDLP